MYQDARGQRLTLYVSRQKGEPRDTAFRFSQEDRVSVFYWVGGNFGKGLSGIIRREQFFQVADAVYKQLNPLSPRELRLGEHKGTPSRRSAHWHTGRVRAS